MKRYWHYIFLLFLLLSNALDASAQERNNLIATKKNLVLLINLESSKKELDTIYKRAGIKDADRPALLKGDLSILIKDGWQMVKRQGDVLQFSRPLKEIKNNPQETPFIITSQVIKNEERHGYLDNAIYGVNKFSITSVGDLPGGMTRFILPGFLKAKRVFLSGSFNDWSTLSTPMTRTETGWTVDIKLKPGAYEYKFIAGGRWMTDPDNLLTMDDGAGNTNSVYYKYNYTFKLSGYPSAHNVTLAGSFNNWNAGELPFQKNGSTWECPIYLHEGMHLYRFLVDGKWIIDPANAEKYTDDKGVISSVLDIGQPVVFKLNGFNNAKNIYLAGDFNKWKPDNIKLKKSAEGWAIPLILTTGNYSYKFIVDGQWITDPANQNQVVYNGQVNSFIAVNPNHTFKLRGYDDAKVVHLAGSFNNWDTNGYTLAHHDGEWSISLCLKPGKTLYKYLVDGNWITDPGNRLWEQNQYDTGNSVLWITP